MNLLILLVPCPKFVYSAGLQFWPKLANFYVFGPFWPMSKCAQLSYLIPKNLQNSMQPSVIGALKDDFEAENACSHKGLQKTELK